MKEIGGYFGLELEQKRQYHKGAIELNTGRNAFEYILKAYNYSKIYLPFYTCEVMLEPLNRLHIPYEFYLIDRNFYPVFDKEINENEAFVYTNYWGLNQKNVNFLKNKFGIKLIVDNSQAFYAKHLTGINTFYSARKFFGVSDGAYLYCKKKIKVNYPDDKSYKRMNHLLKRIDLSAIRGYNDFKKNDNKLTNEPIKKMSKLTKAILSTINYNKVAKTRIDNFNYLHRKLKELNELKLDFSDKNSVPMVYPFLIKKNNLKQELIKNKIFIATYWHIVNKIAPIKSFEQYLYKFLLPLPIDQRYDISDMEKILDLIINFTN